ncbi:DoxX family protein [Macrococcus animalis]|uniref:DoxX family protein n=1 Tax=Macrococcus animalis TaxID=3395467 RepID=UPI0039BDD426
MKVIQLLLRMVLGIGFFVAGILHFLREPNFTKIVPNYLPFKKEIVYISGVMEIIMGIYLVIKQPSSRAKRIINTFLVSVFPANIYMARKEMPLGDKQLPKSALYGRLPLQFVLMKVIKNL